VKRPILTHPNPLLRRKSVKVKDPSDPKFQRLVLDLAETMEEDNGVGIAAPQVGENHRLIVIDTKNGPIAFFNPRILWKSLSKELGEEGCLSVPNVFGLVKRAKNVVVSYVDLDCTKRVLKARGMLARVLQHEIDHLDGILFIDKTVKEASKK